MRPCGGPILVGNTPHAYCVCVCLFATPCLGLNFTLKRESSTDLGPFSEARGVANRLLVVKRKRRWRAVPRGPTLFGSVQQLRHHQLRLASLPLSTHPPPFPPLPTPSHRSHPSHPPRPPRPPTRAFMHGRTPAFAETPLANMPAMSAYCQDLLQGAIF